MKMKSHSRLCGYGTPDFLCIFLASLLLFFSFLHAQYHKSGVLVSQSVFVYVTVVRLWVFY